MKNTRNADADWVEASGKLKAGVKIKEIANEWGVTTSFVRALLAVPNPLREKRDYLCYLCRFTWIADTKYYPQSCPGCHSKAWREGGKTRYAS